MIYNCRLFLSQGYVQLGNVYIIQNNPYYLMNSKLLNHCQCVQCVWLRTMRSKVRFSALLQFLSGLSLEWGLHNLKRTIRQLLDWELTNSMTYGTRRFNAEFTRAIRYSLSWAESTQFFLSISISLSFILILSSHLRLCLPKGLFSLGLCVKILKALLLFYILATWPAHLNLLDLITLTILRIKYTLSE